MLLSHLTSGEEKRRGRSPFCRGRSSSASLFHYLSLHASPENPGRGGGGAKYTWRADVPQMKMYNRGSRHAKLAPTERRLKRVCFKSQPPPLPRDANGATTWHPRDAGCHRRRGSLRGGRAASRQKRRDLDLSPSSTAAASTRPSADCARTHEIADRPAVRLARRRPRASGAAWWPGGERAREGAVALS